MLIMYLTKLPSKILFQFTFLPATDESRGVFREPISLQQRVEYIIKCVFKLDSCCQTGPLNILL